MPERASRHAPDQTEPGLVECRLCGLRWRSLGHHLRRGHEMSVADYRARFGIRPGERLTAPSTSERMSRVMRRTIASGALDEHFAGNRARSTEAAIQGLPVLWALRAAGVVLPTGAPPVAREVIEAIVVAIEAGSKVAAAVKRSPISYTTYHAGLHRHPDLRERAIRLRSAGRRGEKLPRARGGMTSGDGEMTEKMRAGRMEIAQIVQRIEAAHPRATLLYARIAIALMDAAERTLALSDLSEAIGRGRDSTAVQMAVARLEGLGLVRRELMPPGERGGPYYSVELLRTAAARG